MNTRTKAFFVLMAVLMIIGIYAIVRVAMDPNWYFGKSLVPDYVTMDGFWGYVFNGR